MVSVLVTLQYLMEDETSSACLSEKAGHGAQVCTEGRRHTQQQSTRTYRCHGRVASPLGTAPVGCAQPAMTQVRKDGVMMARCAVKLWVTCGEPGSKGACD